LLTSRLREKHLRNSPVEHFAAPKTDTGFFFAAAKAIDLALKDFQPEKVTYNVAVLPAPDGQILV
jgi:hypothetical protein